MDTFEKEFYTNDTGMSEVNFSMIKHLRDPTYKKKFMRQLDSLFTEETLFIGKVVLPIGNTENIIKPVNKVDYKFIINQTSKGIEKLNRQNKF